MNVRTVIRPASPPHGAPPVTGPGAGVVEPAASTPASRNAAGSAWAGPDTVALWQSRPDATIRQVAAGPGINSETLITWAAITPMTRRLTRRRTNPARSPIAPPALARAA